jgi:hypothetical protein
MALIRSFTELTTTLWKLRYYLGSAEAFTENILKFPEEIE